MNVPVERDVERVAAEQSGTAESLAADLASISLYLHVPFCHTRCHYCDFNTYAGMLGHRESYVAALAQEIQLAGMRARQSNGSPRRCRTVFFGGGTPSLLSPEQVDSLLHATRQAFALDDAAEITLEANPGTLEYGRLDALRAVGVNRLSMGAQSFDPDLLRWMGRIHAPEEIETAFAAARKAGFTSINLDFIFALPGQSLATWAETLERAIDLGPEHLSLYSLIVEEGTPLFSWVREGTVHPADDDAAADMYEHAMTRLAAAGYGQYEISNWARAGHECRHNLTYWGNLPYIGLGAGAHSYFGGHRFAEERPIARYISRVRQSVAEGNTTADMLPAGAIAEDEAIPPELEMAETAMVGLRLNAGISRSRFAARYGRTFEQVFDERLADVREVRLIETAGDYIRLTEHGRLLGNEVFARLLPDSPEVPEVPEAPTRVAG
ncbi:MAG TPA: radical SAM family heme chaperone HemW [Ktedonobacterales bacterium]|nr:radical SAM family heme chaperone HemW [Ktedonobacterales bacterium]